MPPGERISIRGLSYHVRRWGDPRGRPLLMLHGARDCAATFQFVVDAFRHEWNIVAPDWRGHGYSDRSPGRNYWIHDLLADLDRLIAALFPDATPDLVGHSMGGNVGGLYIGLRPAAIRRFVSLDAFGPPPHRLPVDMATVLDQWLEPPVEEAARGFGLLEEVAARLRLANPRLTGERAAFLAEHTTRRDPDGRYRWLCDPAMTRSLPSLHTIEEWAAIWSRVAIPARWIGSSDIRSDAPSFDAATVLARRRMLPHAEYTRLADAGHNLHHDRPADVASEIEDFLLRGDA